MDPIIAAMKNVEESLKLPVNLKKLLPDFCMISLFLQAGPVIDDGGIFEHARRSGMIKRVVA